MTRFDATDRRPVDKWTAAHWGALGQELEPESEEAPIGKFSVDLFARDTGTNRAR